MSGFDDSNSIFDDWYRNFLVKRKDSLRGQFVAWGGIQTQAKKKMDEVLDEMKDCDAQIAKCDEVAKRKSKAKEKNPGTQGKKPEPGSNYETPIKVDSDSDDDETPVRMIRYVGVQGESSKFRGQCSGTKLVFGAGVEGGEADMDISEDEGIVKHVIDTTVGAFAEAEEEEHVVGVQGVGAAQQSPQQQQQRDSEEEDADEEEEAEEQGDTSKSANGYPYHYYSPDMSESDDEAYGFDFD